MYPPEYRAWHAGALILARAASRGVPRLTGPCELELIAVWTRPQRRPRSDRWTVPAEVWSTGERIRRPARPDADNVVKAAMDLLNGVAYVDDGQVCREIGETWYAAVGEDPSTTINVRPLPWLREAR